MTNNQNDPRGKFTPRFLPWILAGAAFLLYLGTLNRWVSMLNLPTVARVSGWIWQPDVNGPISLLFTLPFRWLPAAAAPVLLNIFSALCAAATVGLLARTVAILPQDRTDAQRRREHSVFSFLTIRGAWLPPSLAAAACALQIIFWQHATNYTGEMFQLLFFALVIWLMAEYRIDERENRLFLAAFIWGACMTDNWAMVCFLPVFVAAVLWIRGWSFFHLHFLGRMILSGLIGLLFYFLTPVWIACFTKLPLSFGETLFLYELKPQWQVVHLITNSGVLHTLGLISLTTLIPLMIIGIRWKSTFGDMSYNGKLIANFMFHIIHALIFGICLWVAFDPPFSPHQLGAGLGFMAPPELTFHYLDALCVGYFGGYLLLVLGRKYVSRSSSKSRQPAKPGIANQAFIVALGTGAVLSVTVLLWKNTPQILDLNDQTLLDYGKLTVQSLPAAGGFLICDSNEGPWRRLIVQAMLAREGMTKKFVVLDTQALNWPMYQRYLHQQYPDRWPLLVKEKDIKPLDPHLMISALWNISKTNEVYYLHPSFGYYLETFYMEPHGLVYRMVARDTNMVLTPSPDEKLTAENQKFWADADESALARVEYKLDPQNYQPKDNLVEELLGRLHMQRLQNPNGPVAGDFYSEGLNYWGVRLQRAHQLKPAAACFEQAKKLNPDNVVAGINLQFNEDLQAGKKPVIDMGEVNTDRLGKYTGWLEALNINGPFDQPSFCVFDGFNLAQSGCFHQSAEEFDRAFELVPDNLQARLGLAQAHIFVHQPDFALRALQDPLENPAKYALNQNNSTELDVLAASAYFQKDDSAKAGRLLNRETTQHPDNNELVTTAAQALMMHGMYTNALEVIDRRLDAAPNDPVWLFGKGYANIQLKRYDQAASAFSLVLTLQTNNNDALFNRAVSYLEGGKLDSARTDYLRLQKTYTNSFLLAYGLGEIAYKQHDTNEAIRNYTIYLANAQTNTAEATTIRDRLNQLQHP
jgi:tetratricopeptide (TPR) repeat protein